MNGFEQIKSFYSWVFNNPDKIRPTHISLYLFLLNQNNRSMWVEWFKCPYDLAMQGACIGNKNTYYRCLDELQFYKLIEYKKGINNYKAPLIKLIRLYDCEPLTEQVSVPQSEQVSVPQSEPLSVLLNKNTYKLITDNYKTINNNIVAFNNFLKNLNSDIETPDVSINNVYILEYSFDDFWSIYPNKTNKKKAKEKFDKLTKGQKEKIEQHLPIFINNPPFKDYTYPHAVTYLNQERFNDEIQLNTINLKSLNNEQFNKFTDAIRQQYPDA